MMRRSSSRFRPIVGALVVLASFAAWPSAALSQESAPVAPTDAAAFLRVRPLPEGLENVEPIHGAVNVRFLDCEASWPEGYKAHRAAGSRKEGYARKRDIYLYLQASHTYETLDCGCAGKVAPWEPVETIYAGLLDQSGEVTQAQTEPYAAAAARLIDAVELMCRGRF